MLKQPSRALALLEALLVSMVWASSFIFVKMALTELGPLTIGGLRYFLGFCLLAAFPAPPQLYAHSPSMAAHGLAWV